MDRRNFIGTGAAALSSAILPASVARAQGLRRAALVVGVGHTEGLTTLRSTIPGAKSMADFLRKEGYEVYLETDEPASDGAPRPVTLQALKKVVKELVDRDNLHQLLIYFSGHGIRLAFRGEMWLLSNALDDPNEAVNMVKSAEVCRYSRIPNIVFISDACRSTAASFNLEHVDGGIIFPTRNGDGRVAVDKFFAALPGNPALELTMDVSTKDFRSLYTEAFLNAFHDPPAEIVATLKGGLRVVPNRKLAPFLFDETKRLARLYGVLRNVVPDAEVPSADHIYIGTEKKSTPVAGGGGHSTGGSNQAGGIDPPDTSIGKPSLKIRSATTVDAYAMRLLDEDIPIQPEKVPVTASSLHDRNREIDERVPEPGWLQPEGSFSVGDAPAGIVTYGLPFARIATNSNVASTPINDLRHQRIAAAAGIDLQGDAASALVVFEDGQSVVVPVFRHYVTHIFRGDTLVEGVSFEPVPEMQNLDPDMQIQLRELRALVTQATADGAFVFDGTQEERTGNASNFAERIRSYKGYDPTLGILAAYAYSHAYLPDEVNSVRMIMRDDLGVPIFDTELLARQSRGDYTAAPLEETGAVPFCPMVRSGWELLEVKGIALPASVIRARESLTDALWTSFGPSGTELLETALAEGEIW